MKPMVLASRAIPAVIFRGGVFLALLAFLFFPIYWMVATSFRPATEIFVQFPTLWRARGANPIYRFTCATA